MYFMYLIIVRVVHFDPKYISFCRTAQKEKIEREKKEAKQQRAQQILSPATTAAATGALPTPTLPSPATPTQATLVSTPQVTPQSTPQAVGCFGVPSSSFETPCTSKRRAYAAPVSTAATFL